MEREREGERESEFLKFQPLIGVIITLSFSTLATFSH